MKLNTLNEYPHLSRRWMNVWIDLAYVFSMLFYLLKIIWNNETAIYIHINHVDIIIILVNFRAISSNLATWKFISSIVRLGNRKQRSKSLYLWISTSFFRANSELSHNYKVILYNFEATASSIHPYNDLKKPFCERRTLKSISIVEYRESSLRLTQGNRSFDGLLWTNLENFL